MSAMGTGPYEALAALRAAADDGRLDDLAVLTGSDDVDLMLLDDALPVARERALVGAVALYEDEPGRYDRMRAHAVVERMETAWLRDLELQVLQR